MALSWCSLGARLRTGLHPLLQLAPAGPAHWSCLQSTTRDNAHLQRSVMHHSQPLANHKVHHCDAPAQCTASRLSTFPPSHVHTTPTATCTTRLGVHFRNSALHPPRATHAHKSSLPLQAYTLPEPHMLASHAYLTSACKKPLSNSEREQKIKCTAPQIRRNTSDAPA